MRTGTFYWKTEYYHPDNTFTLNDWLDKIQDDVMVIYQDGNYCEVRVENGECYSLMASGNGDSYSHQIEIEKI